MGRVAGGRGVGGGEERGKVVRMDGMLPRWLRRVGGGGICVCMCVCWEGHTTSTERAVKQVLFRNVMWGSCESSENSNNN